MNEPTIKLEPHQVEGVAHLLRRPDGGIVSDPGTMKTSTVLSAFHVLKKRRIIDGMLVLAPLLPAYEAWPPEVEKWGFPFKVVVLHGDKKNQLINEPADIYVVNYDAMPWPKANWPKLKRRHKRWWLVADESTKIKATNTQRFKNLKPLLNDFDRRTILTGTPSPNGLIDLFGQVYLLDQGRALGEYITQYRREYFFQTGYGGYTWQLQVGAEARIYKALGTMLYRVGEEVLNLKKIRYNPIYVTLPPKTRKLYEKFESDFIAELKAGVKLTAVNAGVLSSKLRQVANGMVFDDEHYAHEVHDAKLEALTDLVEQLQGNPLLVVYEFTPDGERIAKHLKAPLINGKMKPIDRKAALARFNEGKSPVIVCQSSVIALGANLQSACHTVAHYGLTWNLENYIQANRRVHRKGQTKRVIVHHIIARDTVDQLVAEVLEKKDATQQRLFKAIKEHYK